MAWSRKVVIEGGELLTLFNPRIRRPTQVILSGLNHMALPQSRSCSRGVVLPWWLSSPGGGGVWSAGLRGAASQVWICTYKDVLSPHILFMLRHDCSICGPHCERYISFCFLHTSPSTLATAQTRFSTVSTVCHRHGRNKKHACCRCLRLQQYHCLLLSNQQPGLNHEPTQPTRSFCNIFHNADIQNLTGSRGNSEEV